MHLETKEEDRLLQLLQQGDQKAFASIFHRYYHRICLYANHYADGSKEAEDLAEESFLRIWQGNRTFQSMDHLKASLYQAVRHIGLNHQTSIRRSEAREAIFMEDKQFVEETRLDQIVHAEVMSELYEAVNKLPDKARQIIIKTYLEGSSNQEAADYFGLSIQTIKNQKLRALSLLRKNLSRRSLQILLSSHLLDSLCRHI